MFKFKQTALINKYFTLSLTEH